MMEKKETEAYKEHLERFSRIEPVLESFFINYKNKDKILKLLEYWLFAIKETFEIYDIAGLDNYIRSSGSSPMRHAYNYEFQTHIFLKNKQSSLAAAKFFLFFSNRLIFPGAPIKGLKDKLISRISSRVFSKLPQVYDYQRKQIIVKILSDYFKNLEYFSEQKIQDALPGLFFSKPISIKEPKKIHVDGTAHSFMDFAGFENLLLFNADINVDSYQHGGGYDCFHCDYYSFFEYSMSENFYGWGLSKNNLNQHRYQKLDKKMDADKKKLIWVERPNYPKLMSPMNYGQYLQHSNQEVIANIYKAIKATGKHYFNAPYPGDLISIDYEGYRGDFLGDKNTNSESNFSKHDLIIFDSSAASLIHFCIENSMIFFLVIDRESHDYFTTKKRRWFSILRENKFAFFHDETQELSNAIEKAYNSEFKVPKDILEFNNITFHLPNHND